MNLNGPRDPFPPPRTGRADFPHPALTNTLAISPRSIDSFSALWGSFRLRRKSFIDRPGLSGIRPPDSSVVRPFGSKRISPPLASTCIRSGPFAPRELPRFFATMGLSESRREPRRRLCIPSMRWGLRPTRPGLPGSSALLSACAVSNHPGKPNGCLRPLLHRRCQASSSLSAWPLSFSVTRQNRVRFRYGSRFRLSRLRQPDYSDPRSIGYMVNGQFTWRPPFRSQEESDLSWRTRGRRGDAESGSSEINFGNTGSVLSPELSTRFHKFV